jgi:hypothetical protein
VARASSPFISPLHRRQPAADHLDFDTGMIRCQPATNAICSVVITSFLAMNLQKL